MLPANFDAIHKCYSSHQTESSLDFDRRSLRVEIRDTGTRQLAKYARTTEIPRGTKNGGSGGLIGVRGAAGATSCSPADRSEGSTERHNNQNDGVKSTLEHDMYVKNPADRNTSEFGAATLL